MLVVHRLRRAGGVKRRLLVGEFVDRLRRGAVGQPRDHARQHEVDEARIFGVAEAAPLRVFERVEDLREIARLRQLGPVLEPEHLRADAGDEGREGAGGDVRHKAQRLDVVRMRGPFVVADQRAVGLAAGRAELVFVDLLEQLALVEFDGAGQILDQLALRRR